jgi:hypothetical protein
MRAPLMGRLSMALTEVQDFVAEMISRLKRTQRRSSELNQEPSQGDQDPVLAMLARAPVDDEPVTDDDQRHIAEGWQAYREGRVVSSEEAKQGCLDARGEKDPREASRAVRM